MFETEQDLVKLLLAQDTEFKTLFDRHSVLKQQVHDAETGEAACDDAHLGTMKLEKLHTKDRMAAIMADYRRDHDGAASSGH